MQASTQVEKKLENIMPNPLGVVQFAHGITLGEHKNSISQYIKKRRSSSKKSDNDSSHIGSCNNKVLKKSIDVNGNSKHNKVTGFYTLQFSNRTSSKKATFMQSFVLRTHTRCICLPDIVTD